MLFSCFFFHQYMLHSRNLSTWSVSVIMIIIMMMMIIISIIMCIIIIIIIIIITINLTWHDGTWLVRGIGPPDQRAVLRQFALC